MRRTDDGFVIAEEDLRLRGAGEVLGTRQSGLPEFRIAQVPNFEELLLAARDDARLILSTWTPASNLNEGKLCVTCCICLIVMKPSGCSGLPEAGRPKWGNGYAFRRCPDFR